MLYCVLILILLEYGLRQVVSKLTPLLVGSLNPYSIGIWSAPKGTNPYLPTGLSVLILILLEYGLRHFLITTKTFIMTVLILILLEYGLRLAGARPKGKNPYVLILILLEYGLRLMALNKIG